MSLTNLRKTGCVYFQSATSMSIERAQTTFEIGQAQRIRSLEHIAKQSSLSASRAIHEARGRARFSKTEHLVPDGPACRIYGAMIVKKVTGNLHVVSLTRFPLIAIVNSEDRLRSGMAT